MRSTARWLSFLLCASCGGGGSETIDGSPPPPVDASLDAAFPDAGAPDAGGPDAAAPDGMPSADAGPLTYPPGPYGTDLGDVIANYMWMGYVDSAADADDDPFNEP